MPQPVPRTGGDAGPAAPLPPAPRRGGWPLGRLRTPATAARPGLLAELRLTRGGPPLGPGGPAVLGPLELTLAPGETVALSGASGIGKSTLLRILAGLETRYTGERRVPERIAMVFQEPMLLPWRDARANLCIATGLGPRAAEDWLGRVGLAGLGSRWPGQLSLGQQRRLALARAFAAAPALLLMDEPFVSLDPSLAEEVMTTFETLRAARPPEAPLTTLIVTHAPEEARRLATRQLRLEGRPARLVTG